MKVQSYIHKIVKNYLLIFCKDLCTHAHTRGVNVHKRVLLQQNAHVHIFTSYARVCTRIFTKNQQIILYFLMNIGLKFHKDPCFCCGDNCKMVRIFKSHQFSICFPYFTVTPLKSLQRWIITEWSWNFLDTSYQNVHM